MKLRDADALKELMARRGLSYADVARAAGVSKGFISHLTGKRKDTMTPLVGYRIAQCLDVPVSTLFDVKLPTAASQAVRQKVAA